MFNYDAAKEMMVLAKKMGPGYEELARQIMNSVYGIGHIDTDSIYNNDGEIVLNYDATVFTTLLPRNSGRYPWNENVEEAHYTHTDNPTKSMCDELHDDIVCHMQNVYGIANPEVNVIVNGHFIDKPIVQINLETDSGVNIKKVIFNDPATIVLWSDGTKTVVKRCYDEIFDMEKGLAMAIAKKAMGNTTEYHKVFKEHCKPIENPWKKVDVRELARNWGISLRAAFDGALNALSGNTDTKSEEKELICPCCSYKIKIPSEWSLLVQEGTTCPNCGLEIRYSKDVPLTPGCDNSIELADKILEQPDALEHVGSGKRINPPKQLTPEEEELCHHENTEK